MTTVFETPAALLDAVDRELGQSDWLTIEQARIDQFADATGDHQWIHVDPERAAEGPYGACIAHGYLTMSLVNLFLPQILEVRGISAGINVGTDRVRFPAPVTVGSRVRGSGKIVSAEPKGQGIQITVRMEVQIEGSERPAAVVDALCRYLPAD